MIFSKICLQVGYHSISAGARINFTTVEGVVGYEQLALAKDMNIIDHGVEIESDVYQRIEATKVNLFLFNADRFTTMVEVEENIKIFLVNRRRNNER